ncbi:Cullin family-domain-containing protein [Lentinula lateritia]|uniref:Cullin family-domain-containing protein n=1 Tax=Lentinula lateritia TaxID=40482 RepID=A0ABQ8VR54_9AGAR|nr:Cullin family-domain-containing protein [Lentinula lateritia]
MNVYTLLELPKSSRGFSSISQSNGPRSGAQLRKVARTDTDLDSASASRSTGVTSGSRRIQISGEGFRPSVLPDPFYSIRHNISVILTPFKQPSLIESYEAVSLRARYIVCVDGKGEGLYNLLKKELEVCMKDKVLESLMKDGEWISFMGRMCDWFHGAVGLLQSLLSPLDQAYVPTVKGTRSINALAYDIFNDRIFGHAGVSKQLRENLSTWIAADRQNSSGERASRSSVAHLLRHFIAHDVYFGSSQYEQYLLTSTEEYYVALVATLNHDMYDDPSAFFEIAYDLIEAEVERAEEVFPPQSRQSIKETTIRALFILPKVAGADNLNDNWLDRLKWLATPETVKTYVTSNRIPTMGKMYHLLSTLSSVSGSRAPLKVLSNAWKVYIHNIVSDIVKVTPTASATPDLEEKMVPNLLKFREQAEGIIDVAFISKETNKPDGDFSQALSDGFISGFKTRRVKPAEMLAKYLDGMMRKGQAKFFESLSKSSSADKDAIAGATQNAQDTLFHSHLLQVLGLYRFSEDKDVFRTFYHRQLTKRLLLGRSASSDAEVAMLRMLKEQYDSEFDMGETMFKDLSLSTELMNEFRNHRLVNGMSDDNLDVRVLQRSAWPFDVSKKQILIPDEMEQQLSNFATFYHKKHGNRTLDWDHALGTMSLKTRFRSPGKDVVEKELSVSLYQGIILLMFQEKNMISFLEIREVQHSIDDDDLRRTLQSLACGKKKLLLKEPPGRDVNDGDMFLFNDKFVLSEEGKKAGYKIHVNSIQAKVSVKESATTNRHIQEDRKHLLDAAIVRIMKAKKQLEYEQLKSQTIEAVKRHFAPEVEEIKSRVEALVEQEYLERAERVPGQKPMFKYVA